MKAALTGHTSLGMLRTAAIDSDNDIDNSTNINQFKAQSSGCGRVPLRVSQGLVGSLPEVHISDLPTRPLGLAGD